MEYTYRETRRITPESLRQLCIQEDWYTHGSNTDYDHLLCDLAGKETLSTDDIAEITLDIIIHSNLSDNDFESVAFKVANTAAVFITRQKHDLSFDERSAIQMACLDIFKRVHPMANIKTLEEMQIVSDCMLRYLPTKTPARKIPRSEFFAAERYARNQIIITLKALNKNKDWPW